jgi:hypothetical protein
MPKPAAKLTLARARAAWISAQLLGGTGALLPALERTGFVRTLGGVDVYLAARARARLRSKDLDAAVVSSDVQVVPAVRGCMYLVARRDVPLALRIADTLSSPKTAREHEKVGIKPGEVTTLAGQVRALLETHGPLSTDAIRRRLPEGAVRSLGELGKKMGISSALPAALRRLELDGQAERMLDGGRLDTERYLWRATAVGGLVVDGDLHQQLAAIFLRGAGTGTARDLAAWAGISMRDATAAMGRLPVVPVTVEGIADPSFALEDTSLAAEPGVQAVAFLPFEDSVVALHGGPALLVDEDHHALDVPRFGAAAAPLGEAKHMMMRGIIAEGRIAALWEFDPDEERVVVGILGKVSPKTRAQIKTGAEELSTFLAKDVGHGRSFSLDTDDALRERAKFVRGL